MDIKLNRKTILITGMAGFIGYSLTKRLLNELPEIVVVGIDNLNDYYDVKLKEFRINQLNKYANCIFIKGDISNKENVQSIFQKYQPEIVVNLAAQAGVRYSLINPDAYIQSNLVGFFNIIEAVRHSYDEGNKNVTHLVYASSSSVYGSNKKIPYSIEDKVDNPVSLYAATKKSNELMAYSYCKLYGIAATGLRFFTVYGPAGRPDMAYYGFTNKLVKGEKIQIYNYGNMYRDFTYIDDIITGVVKVMGKSPDEDADGVRHKIYNIGNNQPVSLMRFIEVLENCLIEQGIIRQIGEKELLPMQPGDVYQTFADIDDLKRDFGFQPQTKLEDGLSAFAKWYKEFYSL